MSESYKWTAMQNDLNRVEGITHEDDAIVSIWLGSLAAYNEGRPVGRWISLPVDEDALEKAYNIVTEDGHHDFYIADSEGQIRRIVEEYSDPFKLNQVAEAFAEMEDYERESAIWLSTDVGYSLDDVLDERKYQEVRIYGSWGDAVEEWIDVFLADLPSSKASRIRPYLDERYIQTEIECTSSTHVAGDGTVLIWEW